MSKTNEPKEDYRIEDHFAALPLSNRNDFSPSEEEPLSKKGSDQRERSDQSAEAVTFSKGFSIMDQSVKGISFCGVRGSGKTTYLTALYRACRKNQQVHLKPADEESKRFIRES